VSVGITMAFTKNNLSIESFKTHFQTFSVVKTQFCNLFCVFLKTGFSCRAPNCATYNLCLTSSDRAEIFTTDTLKYSPVVESADLISEVSIRIYRVLNVKNLVLAKIFKYFFYNNKKKVRFLKKLKINSEI